MEIRWAWGDAIGGVGVDDLEMYSSGEMCRRRPKSRYSWKTQTRCTSGCRAAGANVLTPIVTERWGLRGFTVEDADGNRIGIAHEVHFSPDGLSANDRRRGARNARVRATPGAGSHSLRNGVDLTPGCCAL